MLNRNKGIGWETLLVAGLLILTFIPFLGENLFSTKGEPREAIVAVSMLQQGDWILPVSSGADIPYKPPMLAWCIAVLGWLNGGVVTEFLSRLPSALSLIIMSVAGFRFFARRTSVGLAAAMTLITATSVEVFRTATICRVDMLLTMFLVTGLYALYRQWERHRTGTWLPSLTAAALMTGAVLTKGPVGMLLPCMVVWVFRLMKGNGFWQTTVSVGLSGVLSLIVPFFWYVSAYQQGGEEFYRLAMEENFGRFTGTMSYESHENPVWYNFLSLAWGLAPYTLLLLFGVCVRSKKQEVGKEKLEVRRRIESWWNRLRGMDSVELFSLLAAVLIFLFYCFPKSKRSVYLLPVYPFVGYFIAVYVRKLAREGKWCVKAYGWIICITGILSGIAVWIVAEWGIPSAGNRGVEAVVEYMRGYAHRFWPALMWLLVIGAGLLLCKELLRGKPRTCFGWTLVYTLCVYCLLQAMVLPAVMNVKSDKLTAEEISRIAGEENTVYSYMPDRLSRFYTVNYYMDDRLRLFDRENPQTGYVIVNEGDMDSFTKYTGGKFRLEEVSVFAKKGDKPRKRIHLLKFEKKFGKVLKFS